jgi:hypothetical protein
MDKQKPVFIQNMRMNDAVFAYDDIIAILLSETRLPGQIEDQGRKDSHHQKDSEKSHHILP